MNILMINYEYPPLGGGGGVFTQQLAEELGRTNNITLITSRFQKQKAYEFCNGVEIFRVPVLNRDDQNAATLVSMLSFFPASLLAAYRIMRKRRFDVIHSMFAIPSALSGLALAKRFRLPHVLSILGGDVYDPSKRLSPHRTPLLRYTVKKIMEWSDVVVALSADISKKAAKYYKVSREIKIHHLGIIEPRFQKIGRECLNFKESDLLLITIGRLVRRKSVEHLIEVIKMLNDKQVKLIVIGDGPERTKLQKLAGDSSVSDRVFFFGNVSDEEKFQLLSLADVYLSSSQHEGFGIVFLEAMMSRLPVVSYDEGGHVEFLIHEKTGFLVQHGKIGELTARTKELCDDETLRKEMGRFNEEYVKQFSIRNCAKKYQWVYDSLLEGASTCLLLSSALTLSAE